jgi:hypothetical protein
MSFYEGLVALGGGLMKGKFLLQAWKNMHPEQHYFQKHVDLYERIDDPVYLSKEETFRELVRKSDRFAWSVVSAGHAAIV